MLVIVALPVSPDVSMYETVFPTLGLVDGNVALTSSSPPIVESMESK